MTTPKLIKTEYYPPGSVAGAFLRSEAFVTAIRGPIGSGKSTACVIKLLRIAQKQPQGPDGIRRSRFAIIRNTMPMLKTTTIPTWHQWVPKYAGKWLEQGPTSHFIKRGDMEMEVWFVALDRPDDVKKLLSMELTAAWVNEAREVPKAIVDGLTGRVGRYPAVRDGGVRNPQILLDTNPCDTDHWWYILSEKDDSEERGRQILESTVEAEEELRQAGFLNADQPLFEFFAQPSGTSSQAENINNLPAGYYARAKAGKTSDWVNVYVHGQYGFVMEGKPLYPEYNDSTHCQEFNLITGLPVRIGLDFGLTPAALFAQRTTMGQWRWSSELVTESTGIYRFAELIKAHLADHYPGFTVAQITGDPSGDTRSPSDKHERSTFQILAAQGVMAKPANSNDPVKRREAVARPLTRMIDGEPGLLIHPGCKVARKGMMGGYHYRRMQVSTDERYDDKPVKNIYSHICDAGQYLHLGGGEWEEITHQKKAVPIFCESFKPSDPGMGY